jgi:hypothetical protein
VFGIPYTLIMTAIEIQKRITPYKDVSLRQVHRYLKRFKIRRFGVRQNPDQFPDDSAEIILRRLGLNGQRKAA